MHIEKWRINIDIINAKENIKNRDIKNESEEKIKENSEKDDAENINNV